MVGAGEYVQEAGLDEAQGCVMPARIESHDAEEAELLSAALLTDEGGEG